jgi:hypothetical protein
MKSSKQAKTLRSTRRVRFSEYSTVIVTRRKTQEELKSVWYAKSEMKQFEKDARRATEVVLDRSAAAANAYIKKTLLGSQEKLVGTELICGIEHGLSPEVTRVLLTARSKAINDVLQEQARQEASGEHDSTRMAAVSKRMSMFPRMWRHRVAVVNSTE